jgi:hypothetical protein
MIAGAGVAVEKLDRIYFCAKCKTVFLFKADAEDHERAEGHEKISEMPFDP